jgi:hypothetical protein
MEGRSVSETLDAVQAEQHRLIEESAALEELQQTEGWRIFHGYVSRYLEGHQNVLAGGGITDIGEYRFIAGRVQGIQQVLDVPRLVFEARERALNPPETYEDPLSHLDTEEN